MIYTCMIDINNLHDDYRKEVIETVKNYIEKGEKNYERIIY